MSSINFTFDDGPSAALGRSSVAGVADRAAGLWAVVRRWLSADDSPSRLLCLSDHLLRDAGLNRVDLERQAMMWQPQFTRLSH